MSQGFNPRAVAYAIAHERGMWWPNNSTPEARANMTEALDRLARDLAGRLHPNDRAAFLAQSDTTER